MEMLPNVLNLAAAGGMELADASDMITDSQSALGLTLGQTSELVDKMAKASSKSNTSVSQLGSAILTVGGTAKTLAGGTTELSTALGILADNGVKGAEGGTALRNIILALSAPTKQAAKAMESLGVNAYDSNGNLRPLNATFEDLNGALSSMTQGQQTEVLSTLFNKVDLKSANALLANSGERFEELSGYIDDAAGAAQKMAETQLDNLTGDVTMFKSALEGAKIAVSDALTPSIREFVQVGTEGLSKITEGFREGGLSGALDAFGEVLGQMLNYVIERLPDMVNAGMQLLGALGQGLRDNLPMIIDSATEIILILVNSLIEALPAIGEAAIAIVGELAKSIGAALPELIPAAISAIITFVESLIEHADLLIDGALALIQGLVDGITTALPLLLQKAPDIIVGLVTAIIANLPRILEVGAQIILSLIEGILMALPELLLLPVRIVEGLVNAFCEWLGINSPSTVFMEIGNNIIQGLIEGLSAAWQFVVDLVSSLAQGLADLFGGAWELVRDVTAAAWEGITSFLSGVWDNIKNLASAAWEGIKNALAAAWDAISSVATEVWTAISDFLIGVWEGVKEAGVAAWDAITEALSMAWEALKELWSGAVDFFVGIWGYIRDAAIAAWDAIMSIFAAAWDFVQSLWEGAVDFFVGVWDAIAGVFAAVPEFFAGIFEAAWNAITSVWDGVTEFFSGVWESICDCFSGAFDAFVDIGGNIIKGIWEGITSLAGWLWDNIKGFFGGIMDGIMGLFGIASPSKWAIETFGYVMKGVGLGFEQGLPSVLDTVDDVMKEVQDEMSIDPLSIGLDASNASYIAPADSSRAGTYTGENASPRGGDTFNFYSPKALDAVSAAREMKKAKQQMSLGYV
jgi:TP901 family phage tail tape measure protein